MLEITSDDIALLNDGDLRTLVGRLCESEMKAHGLPTSAVTWGGHQNANDGGLDVHVALPNDSAIGGFVPRPDTGFQVKAEDMPRAKILEEMAPSGVIRPVIQELASQSGSYILVSSIGSTSFSALRNRRSAMAEAVKGLHNAQDIHLDFYDRNRIATWVRDHAGLILWVRERIGKSIKGWHSYGPWAYPAEGEDAEYLVDDDLRIHTRTTRAADGFSAKDGLRRIRDLLREPKQVVRLVGLSGVGKTRFVQALFDRRIGDASLDPLMALYTNIVDEPDPQPIAMASDLMALGNRAILVIDNCTPELHRRLSDLCRSSASRLSVITVEYDIREDEPEGTDVFKLKASSISLTENLISRRFPGISAVDVGTIAKFSGGNARVAISLAGTVGKNDTVAGLNDEELFQRLFHQRQQPNETLFLAAQALSLVYSFQGEDISDGDQGELEKLGALIGLNAQALFRAAAELLNRDLVQRRGVWRAVLPHAIANRLARKGLQNIPFSDIHKQLIAGGNTRLFRSFSRRLGYLDDSSEARGIVSAWLAPGGLLGNIAELNDLGFAVFENVAPVDPESVLGALERRVAHVFPQNAVTALISSGAELLLDDGGAHAGIFLQPFGDGALERIELARPVAMHRCLSRRIEIFADRPPAYVELPLDLADGPVLGPVEPVQIVDLFGGQHGTSSLWGRIGDRTRGMLFARSRRRSGTRRKCFNHPDLRRS